MPEAADPPPPPVVAHSPARSAPDWQAVGQAASWRLGARMKRVAIVAIIWGVIGFVVMAVALPMTDAAVGAINALRKDRFDTRALFASILLVLVVAPAFLCGLMAFYGIRLLARSGRSEPKHAADNLFKLRFACTPLLLLAMVTVAVDVLAYPPFGGLLPTGSGVLCCAVCCFVLIQLRRAAWDVAVMEGASVAGATAGRGFAVLPAAGTVPIAAVATAGTRPPIAALSTYGGPWERGAEGAGAFEGPGDTLDSGYQDWETLVHSAAIAAMALYVFPAVRFVIMALSLASGNNSFTSVFGSSMGGAQMLASLSGWGGDVCSLALVLWGLLCLSTGPRLRRTLIGFAWAALALLAVIFGLRAIEIAGMRGSRSWSGSVTRAWLGQSYDYSGEEAFAFQWFVAYAAYPALLLILLSRRPVKELFARRLRKARRSVD